MCVGVPQKFRAVVRPEHPPTGIPRNATVCSMMGNTVACIVGGFGGLSTPLSSQTTMKLI